jgi:hypothetical protein
MIATRMVDICTLLVEVMQTVRSQSFGATFVFADVSFSLEEVWNYHKVVSRAFSSRVSPMLCKERGLVFINPALFGLACQRIWIQPLHNTIHKNDTYLSCLTEMLVRRHNYALLVMYRNRASLVAVCQATVCSG